jgi:hypothetical protein
LETHTGALETYERKKNRKEEERSRLTADRYTVKIETS